MKLRKILLILDQSFNVKESREFNYQARSLGHYIGRHIEKLSLETPYSQLVFGAQNKNMPEVERYFPQSLLVRVGFEFDQYKKIEHSDDSVLLNNYFISLLTSGLRTLRAIYPEVAVACEEHVESFVAGGYVNEWMHSSTKVSKSIRVTLNCAMSYKEFTATLCVVNTTSNSINAERVVFRSKPDELLFHSKLGKIKIEQGRALLIDKFEGIVGFVELPP